MFVGPLEGMRLRKCRHQPRLFGEFLASRTRGIGFGVARLCDGSRAAPVRQFQDLAFELITLAGDGDRVADTHQLGWFHAPAIQLHLAAGHGLGRERCAT